MKHNVVKHLPWLIIGFIGACCLGVIALRRGEHVSALWIVVSSVAVYLVVYRYYSLYIAKNVMRLDPARATPAVLNNDGLNYVPTHRNVLFGHHFAAIAGAGPLVGPVLAAQCRILSCCSCQPAAMAFRSGKSSRRRWAGCPGPSRCLAVSLS